MTDTKKAEHLRRALRKVLDEIAVRGFAVHMLDTFADASNVLEYTKEKEVEA